MRTRTGTGVWGQPSEPLHLKLEEWKNRWGLYFTIISGSVDGSSSSYAVISLCRLSFSCVDLQLAEGGTDLGHKKYLVMNVLEGIVVDEFSVCVYLLWMSLLQRTYRVVREWEEDGDFPLLQLHLSAWDFPKHRSQTTTLSTTAAPSEDSRQKPSVLQHSAVFDFIKYNGSSENSYFVHTLISEG